ncbi:MAG: hypothetical protein V4664_01810 [Patescibacteria group bacterium]
MQLPGKNILVLGAVCLSIIGAAAAYKLAQTTRANIEANNKGGIVTSENQEGIKSSNKLLSALQEIELASSAGPVVQNPFAPAEGDTLTDRLSKNFFSSYVQTQSVDNTDLPNDEALVNSALNTVDVSKLPREKYTTSDMHIIAGNTKEELHAYGNNFVIMQNTELALIQQNPSAYKNNLNAIGSIYATIALKLLDVQVPVALAAEHLAIANAFYLSAEDFKLINDQVNDPMKSLLGLRQYKDAVERQRQMYTDIAAYLKANGILFDKTEPGYFWTSFDAESSQSGTSTQ